MRTEKALKIIRDFNCDALLLLNESNMHYFCNFSPSEGAVIFFKDGTGIHLVDSRYTEAAQNHSKDTGLQVIEIMNPMTDEIAQVCKDKNVSALAFENETISFKTYNALSENLSCDFIGINDSLMRIRNVKDEEEIKYMKEANRIAEISLAELLNHIKPGKTEKELQAYFDYLMAKNGSDGLSFDTILLTGAHTSLPHGVPSDSEVKNGEFVLIDFGATYKGYHSDMTRTFAVGSASDEMKEMYELVLKAQLAGIKALKPGAKCAEVYKAAYDVLDEKQMAQYFRHGLGHGVGLDIHEGFSSSPRSKDTYEIGNVTSIEPGIYLPNKFGIRIEDVCIVTANGNENISTFNKQFTIL